MCTGTAAVATTRCQYKGGGVNLLGVSAYFVSVQLSNLLVYNYQTNATAGQKPRSPCEQTDASENITFPCIR